MATSAEPERFIRIPMHQGLLESQESSKVPIGFTTELVNWVPEQTGGLRARGKWLKGSTAGLPATRQNRGIGTFNRFTPPSIVQVSGPTQFTYAPNTGTHTPVVAWATPTTAGNMLVCFVSAEIFAVTAAMTFTGLSGWTERIDITTSQNAMTGVLEFPSAPAQSGNQSPFSIFNTNNQSTSLIVWMVELSGVTTFDKSGTKVFSTDFGSPMTATLTGPTAQASEIVLALDTAKGGGTDTGITLGTTSTGWSELSESRYNIAAVAGTSTRTLIGALYTKTNTAIETSSITVERSGTVQNVSYSIVAVAYKGWNAESSVAASEHNLLTANYNGTTADIYAVRRDTLDTATFSIIDAAVPNGGELIAFVMGMGAAYYTGLRFPTIRKWNGVTATAVPGSPVGARCIAISHDRMWVGGTPSYPARLLYTNLLDPAAWSGSGSGFWDIGTDDGEFIEDITPFNDGLLIGKETSLWFLSGSSTTDFARHQLPSGGAAPGRSLLTTPFGAVIAGTDQVWLYDGDTVTRLGNAIEVSYGPQGYVTTSYQDGSIYIADHTAGRVYVFNLGGPVGTWRVEECEDTIGTLYNVGGRQFMGPYSTTVGSLVNYRDFPAPARGKDYDPLGMSYRMRTGDLWLDGALRPGTPRQLYLQLRQRDGDLSEPGLVVTPVFDGVDGTDCPVDAGDPGTRRVKVEGFGQGGRHASVGFGITQALEAGDASVFDIEDAWIEYIRESTL